MKKISFCLAILMMIHFCPATGAETFPEETVFHAELPTETPTEHPTEAPTTEPTEFPTEQPAIEPTPEFPAPEETPLPSESPAPEETPEPIESPAPEETPLPSDFPIPEKTPEPIESPFPAESPIPEESPLPSEAPTESPEPSETPPTEDQNPDDVPEEVPPEIEEAERDRSVDWRGAVESDEPGLPIPLLFQSDYPEIVLYYNGIPKSVATSGCGATSISMVIAYLTGNTDQNPYTLFCAAVDDGRYHGNGLSHGTLQWLAEQYGVYGKWIEGSESAIINALNAGIPVIAHMGEGAFTEKGHYIVLRGLTEDGKVLVGDPASRERSHMAFPISSILDQARVLDGFMVCTFEPIEEEAPTREEAPPSLDANGSGAIDLCDAQMIYDIIAHPDAFSPEKVRAADVNGDGIVNEQDILHVLEFMKNETEGGAI